MRKLVMWALLSVILLGTIGCSPGGRDTTPPITYPTVSFSADDISTCIEGNNVFTFDLYQKIKEPAANVFYSPYSISNALALVYAGAGGDTADQMAAALDFDLPADVLLASLSGLQQDLEKRNDSSTSQLSLANALWGQKGQHFLAAYLNMVNTNNDGAFKTLDFARSAGPARLEINQWVSDKTNSRINELLKPGSIDAGTVMVITNAVYFKAPWQYIFRDSTVDGPFYTLEGKKIAVPMMQHDVMHFKYARGDNYQAIDLPYRDCDLSMLVILPDEGQFTPFENSLDNEKTVSILQNLKDTNLTLSMPKFKFESAYLLNEYLKALGMIDAFGSADFLGMADSPGLFITQVLHSTFISVDENGTEAAAGIGAIVAGMTQVDLVIDRPFIFLIRDKKTGSILFMGRVLNPNSP